MRLFHPISLALTCFFSFSIAHAQTPQTQASKHIIIFVWDGLRPDSVSKTLTPNLYALAEAGAVFKHHHSSYPTFTMMNAASFATGTYAGQTGFFGNVLWDPKATGTDSAGSPVDFNQPVFTEDYQILKDLDHDPLLGVETLFQSAHEAGMATATIGKSGPAFMQDYHENSTAPQIILDEKHIFPLDFAEELLHQHYPIPALSARDFKASALDLPSTNGNPTQAKSLVFLKTAFGYTDGVTPDPAAALYSPYDGITEYLMHTFISYILFQKDPTLSLIWLRNPDTTEHNYGPGSLAYQDALRSQDQLLGLLEKALKAQGRWDNTDLIIVSDHGHSSVSGPLDTFPLRQIQDGQVSNLDPQGYAVSGDFRPADLLNRAGFKAYDGVGCEYDPILSGVTRAGKPIYPTQSDKTGKLCGHSSIYDLYGDRKTTLKVALYTTPSYLVPEKLPSDAIIVANNGGSTYFYVPSHDPKLIVKLTRFLQSREEFDTIFVDDRYGNIPGTLSLSQVKLENPRGKSPDLIAGSSYDEKAVVAGMPGTEFNTGGIDRGMHGSFSPIDVHNTLIAIGPDFKAHFVDTLPSGNVDVPVTVAYLLNLPFTYRAGRPLLEALQGHVQPQDYELTLNHIAPQKPADNLIMQLPTDPNGQDIDVGKTHYTLDLQVSQLKYQGQEFWYFDWAKAKRY